MNQFLMNQDFDAFDDDLEVLDLLEYGFPRKIYERADHFNNMDQLSLFKRFRLRKNTVLEVLGLIEDQLEFPYDRNNSVSPLNQLLATLRFYSTGGHLLSIADFSGIHVSTASRIVSRTSRAIASHYRDFIQFPTNPMAIRTTQNSFYNIARFPRLIGAVDCTHVKIQSCGGEEAEIYRNRKQYHSVNVQAICNANLEFTDVVARWPGSCHDSTIFNNSRIKRRFERGHFRNCFMIGDSGYSLRPYLMTPLGQPNGQAEQLYNESHIRTRNVIERCFGVWKRRFPILAYGCRVKLQTLYNIILACAILHNIARKSNEEEPPLPDEVNLHELQVLIDNGQVPAIEQNHHNRNHGEVVRRSLVNNFFSHL